MGLVLAFDTTPRQASRPVARRSEPAKSADILFFTGVRYERNDRNHAPDPVRSADPAEQPTPAS